MHKYIITETEKYKSLDPLDGDKTSNLQVVRMIYLTPLEITKENDLSSSVLQSFSYDDKTKVIHWKIKEGLKFSNGEDITSEDVALAVSRMVFHRPTFPVIESIDGIAEWLKEKEPLKTFPKGIKVTNHDIEIKLTHKFSKPLFRFCLELFSIIPKSCINLSTGKISCEKIPTSGYYRIAGETERSIDFTRNNLPNLNFNGVENIRFEYWALEDVEKKLENVEGDSVVAGNESHLTKQALEKIQENFKVFFLPAARFTDLDINRSDEFFKDKICRQIFVKTFRESFGQVASDYFNLESSIFTKIVPGYLSNSELESREFSKIKKSDYERCKEKIRVQPPKWGLVESERDSNINRALQMTFRSLGGHSSPTFVERKKSDLGKLFDENKISIFYGESGFWAQDAAGDLQMLFTPGLHKSLDFITQDQNLQKLIRNLKMDPSDQSRFVEINRYIHDEAMFNVYSHTRRFFFTKKSNTEFDLPFAITSPFPWHVFEVTFPLKTEEFANSDYLG